MGPVNNIEAAAQLGLESRTDAIREIWEQVQSFRAKPTRALVIGEIGTGKKRVWWQLAEALGESQRLRTIDGSIYSSDPEGFITAFHGGHDDYHPLPSLRGTVPSMASLTSPVSIALARAGSIHPVNQSILGRVFEDDRHGSPTVKVAAVGRMSLREKFLNGEVPASFYLGFEVRIRMPTLRERLEDFDLLVPALLGGPQFDGLEGRMVEEEAIEELKNHAWPGNMWELTTFLYERVKTQPGKPLWGYEVRTCLSEWKERKHIRPWQI